MRIRQARPDDVDAIVQVGHRTWPATYAFAGPAYIADGLATWWSTAAIERSLATTTVLVVQIRRDKDGEPGRPDVVWMAR
jgi:hypothetical protein